MDAKFHIANTYSTFADAIHGSNVLILWFCLARSRHVCRVFAYVQSSAVFVLYPLQAYL